MILRLRKITQGPDEFFHVPKYIYRYTYMKKIIWPLWKIMPVPGSCQGFIINPWPCTC